MAISDRADFVCPLLPCLQHFKDLESCLRHLSDCSCFSDANYWCPFCSDKENFAAAGPSRRVHLRSPASRKSSRLKRATAFIKHFIRSRSMNRRAPKPSSKCSVELYLPYTTAALPDIGNCGVLCELEAQDRQSVELSGLCELEAQDRQPVELSGRLPSRRRWSVQSFANDATQAGCIEDFNCGK